MKLIATALLTTSVLSPSVTGTECFCGESGQGFFYTTADESLVEWMDEYPWEFESIGTGSDDEPGCLVYVTLLADGDAPLETGDIETHYSNIYWNDAWVSFPTFETEMRSACLPLIS